jgi:acetyl-CoA acetyltransferase
MANQLVAGGMADCVLALGFEKMQRGSLTSQVIMNIIRLLLLAAAHSKVD